MSKVTKRKITLESSSDKSSSSRRQSVFERLGTKSVSVREAGEGFCRHWKQNGTCPYGKTCIFVSTHTLISPSKRVAKIQDTNSESKQVLSLGGGGGAGGGDGWDIASLEYEDERALERRRLLLQRELKRQMRREQPTATDTQALSSKASAGGARGGASSSSSSGSSSSSDSSSSDSSDSMPPTRPAQARLAPALPSRSRSPPTRQQRLALTALSTSSGKPMHKERSPSRKERSRDKPSRSVTRPSGRADKERDKAGRRTSPPPPPPPSRSRNMHSPARSTKTGGSRHGGGQSSPARPSSKRSVSLERRDKHKRSLSPRPRPKTNKERSPRRQERGGGGRRQQTTTTATRSAESFRDERKKKDEADRPRLKDKDRRGGGEHEDPRSRERVREREREEALERCRERQREREREQQLTREKERTREREREREAKRGGGVDGRRDKERGGEARRTDKQKEREKERTAKDRDRARSFDRNVAEVAERSERRRADNEERGGGAAGKEQAVNSGGKAAAILPPDRYHHHHHHNSPPPHQYDRTNRDRERGRFGLAEEAPQQQRNTPHHRRNRGGSWGSGAYDEPKRDWEFNEWVQPHSNRHGGGGGEWGAETGGDEWGAGGGGCYGGGEPQQWGGGGDWTPADWPHQPNNMAAAAAALQPPPQPPLEKSGRGRQGQQAEKEAAECDPSPHIASAAGAGAGAGGVDGGMSLKRARLDEDEVEAKRPRLEEALSDISDDPDEILNREDLEPEPQDATTQEQEHLRHAFGGGEEEGLGFEEISDEELDEASEASRAANRGVCMDALGVDWASLVRESRHEATAPAAPGSALSRWSPLAVFARIGVSLRYAGKQAYDEIDRRLKESKEGEGLAHPVAALHVSLRARVARRRTLFADLGARALSARHDIALRRELCGLSGVAVAGASFESTQQQTVV